MIYAVYNVFNTLRHEATQPSLAEIYNARTKQVREAVKGHATSMDIVKQLWTTNAATPLPPLSSQKIGLETPITQTGRNQGNSSSSSVPASSQNGEHENPIARRRLNISLEVLPADWNMPLARRD